MTEEEAKVRDRIAEELVYTLPLPGIGQMGHQFRAASPYALARYCFDLADAWIAERQRRIQLQEIKTIPS